MIGVVGINHQTANIKVRELFSFSENVNIKIVNYLKNNKKYFQEAFVLSTCNRTEVYFRFQDICIFGSQELILKAFQKILGIEIDQYRKYFYAKSNEEAFKHIFTVASGLDSLAIGEYQIVNQLKESYYIAQKQQAVNKYLTRLMDKALAVSKIVRNKTGIKHKTRSISFIAVDKCQSICNILEDKKILLIGLGETGELVLKKFIQKNIKNITITNRTLERAKQKAKLYNGNYLSFDEALAAIADYDIIVTSTSAGKIILSENHVKNALELKNKTTPTIFIDLSVPRNIDNEVDKLNNVTLINVDDLESELSSNQEEHKKLIQIGVKYIEKGHKEFIQWISLQNISPLANNIKEKLLGIHAEELQFFVKNKSSEEKKLIEIYGNHIAEKYSRIFINNLKCLTENGKKIDYIKIANKIFE